ncbi:hypothetical protein ABT404_52485, partial [Streptomyces hyaluromycini]
MAPGNRLRDRVTASDRDGARFRSADRGTRGTQQGRVRPGRRDRTHAGACTDARGRARYGRGA